MKPYIKTFKDFSILVSLFCEMSDEFFWGHGSTLKGMKVWTDNVNKNRLNRDARDCVHFQVSVCSLFSLSEINAQWINDNLFYY